jgi:hypothetical protein
MIAGARASSNIDKARSTAERLAASRAWAMPPEHAEIVRRMYEGVRRELTSSVPRTSGRQQ